MSNSGNYTVTPQIIASGFHILPEEPKQVGDVTSNARGSGARFNSGKAPLDLIPLWIIANSFAGRVSDEASRDVQKALYFLGEFQTTQNLESLDRAIVQLRDYWSQAANVFDYGRRKYAEWNWAKGMAWSVPLACAARHALNVLSDEEVTDSESGYAHVGHMLCNLVMLRTFYVSWPSGNDLPKPELFTPPPVAPEF
ncbi:TPA: dATP/dGTP diphosphohydrolase domain-containing protein [Stenotrophomonas maltophilia]|nr:hypothetical protein B7H26_04595 [Stenotrophomonas maltophilia]MBH1451101.1 hypothetical protein [Stenotrophomonas maltophilia]